MVLSLFLCNVVDECSIFVFVEDGITLLLFSWSVSVLAVRFFHSLVFDFKFVVLLFLLKSLLIPHTRVCGLS